MVIRVKQGKGQKDRYVMLSPKLLIRSAATGVPFGRRSGCSRVMSVCPLARVRLSSPVRKLAVYAVSASRLHSIPSGMDLRFTCSRPAPTSVRSSYCSDTRGLATTARYLRIATSKVCSTSSPLDLLPCPVPVELKPASPQYF